MSGQVERGCTSRTLCIRQNSPSTTSLYYVYTHTKPSTLNRVCICMYVCMHVCVNVRVRACVCTHKRSVEKAVISLQSGNSP
jgi:hypothetical protein